MRGVSGWRCRKQELHSRPTYLYPSSSPPSSPSRAPVRGCDRFAAVCNVSMEHGDKSPRAFENRLIPDDESASSYSIFDSAAESRRCCETAPALYSADCACAGADAMRDSRRDESSSCLYKPGIFIPVMSEWHSATPKFLDICLFFSLQRKRN